MSPNLKAFLNTIAVSELGYELLGCSDNGYNVIVGSTAKNPILFASYADHPRKLIALPKLGIKSTAAGRYQLLARYYDAYKKSLKLPDFSPTSQDAIAIQQIKEQKALEDVEAGRFAVAIGKVKNIWASLPGAGYGQNEHTLPTLQAAYTKAGGKLA